MAIGLHGMATTAPSGGCLLNSDDQFGPRVDIACRYFDFILLFEDTFFVALPAAIFLILAPNHLPLQHSHLLFPISRLALLPLQTRLSLLPSSSSLLHSSLLPPPPLIPPPSSLLPPPSSLLPPPSSLLLLPPPSSLLPPPSSLLPPPSSLLPLPPPSSLLSLSTTLCTPICSFLSDQRSLHPSGLLVPYFSLSTLLSLPLLRTATQFLRPGYKEVATPETTTSFWARSFFTWALPFFREGYGKVLALRDIPKVDADLEEVVGRANVWMFARIRSGLIAGVYRHTASLQATAVKDSAAITLMGTDVERIVQNVRLVHELWASIPEAAIEAARCSEFGPDDDLAWVERVEKRVAVTVSMLGDMKAVKMLGLSGALRGIVTQLRVVEMKTSERVRGLFVWQIVVGNTPATMAQFVTFAVYAIISVTRNDGGLLGPQAFASISLINLVTFPVMIFCQTLPAFIQAVPCFGSIEEYYLKETRTSSESPVEPEATTYANNESHLQQLSPRSTQTLISFENASISWSSDSDSILKDLTLTINPGLTAIY
ncbi:hypothetical protein B0T14DRAFT_561223 [Immersiella caudata]|uniref:Uncharacterized protein n=1 Tax=Immersiella caudata TaxID=314043 RepID=A0AA39XGM3_9PEZI|nr:hypothetical protein B0T14DRAFT_561223 [Immersiella caudata]